MMWGSGYGVGWVMWVVMGSGVVAFWVVVILAIRALLPPRDHPVGPLTPDPITVLKERLARGEVSADEYEQRRRLIVDGH